MMKPLLPEYDVIVVGAGHAGCEAACIAARLGSRTLLITLDMNKIAQMSCNPAIGGIAKGQIVREIDALGGQTGIVTDKSSIQFRMLNLSKGPAMWSPRAQCDRMKFSQEWRTILEHTEGLELWQDDVVGLLLGKNEIAGVRTALGVEFKARKVILTNGTFLNGLMHIGRVSFAGGRIGEPPSHGLTEQLVELGFTSARMKTGTPVRIDGRSIDFSKLTEQKGDNDFHRFSYSSDNSWPRLQQRSCYITYTNINVHDVLREGFKDSPLFNGTIKSTGPRYCPSIETKLNTFADRDSHLLFLEPEGETTTEYYLNGFSSSLPWDVQLRALRLVKGLENVRIFRPGYAIEYDFFHPTQLVHTLETKLVRGLYFAGQINGTTGYEEAAAQGLVAGINAHLSAHASADSFSDGSSDNFFNSSVHAFADTSADTSADSSADSSADTSADTSADSSTNGSTNGSTREKKFTLGRDEAYIGVLIDDLVTKGVDEPYRMFTSRAEYRILLRQDNADARLTEKGYRFGTVDNGRYTKFIEKTARKNSLIEFIRKLSVKPEEINDCLENCGSLPLRQGTKLVEILARPNLSINYIRKHLSTVEDYIQTNELGEEIIESAEIELKYAGYIERERLLVEKLSRLEDIVIHGKFNYNTLTNLSMEARQKLEQIQPRTLGQASRISGVSPADINVLLVLLGR
ncbi:hypothetical protein FACS1894121_0990 [Bacteroidia bacterium]|nr:hypothetical protein FACS1894121_0990 [Bacteroidia bacterium]